MITKKESDMIIQMVFVISLVLIGVLSFVQGRWQGMRTICPEPNVIVTNRTEGINCMTKKDFLEQTEKIQENNFNLGDYYDFKT